MGLSRTKLLQLVCVLSLLVFSCVSQTVVVGEEDAINAVESGNPANSKINEPTVEGDINKSTLDDSREDSDDTTNEAQRTMKRHKIDIKP